MSNLLKRAMSISMRRGVAAAAVCLCVAIAADAIRAQQPRVVVSSPQPQGLTRTGSAAVTGTVLDAASGRAVAGAIVVLEERRPGERARSLLQVSSPTGRFASSIFPPPSGTSSPRPSPGIWRAATDGPILAAPPRR